MVTLEWDDPMLDFDLHVLQPRGTWYQDSDCWSANRAPDWCQPGAVRDAPSQGGGLLEEQVVLNGARAGLYTVAVVRANTCQADAATRCDCAACIGGICTPRSCPGGLVCDLREGGCEEDPCFAVECPAERPCNRRNGRCEEQVVSDWGSFAEHPPYCEDDAQCVGEEDCHRLPIDGLRLTCLLDCFDGRCPAGFECCTPSFWDDDPHCINDAVQFIDLFCEE